MASFISATSQETSAGTSVTTVASLSVQVGDLIVTHTSHEGTLDTCAISNSGTANSYSPIRDLQHSNNDLCAYSHYAIASAAQSITFTSTLLNSRNWLSIRVAVFRPTASETLTLDNSTEAQGSGTAQATGSFAVTVGAGIAFASFSEYSDGTGTFGTGWTETTPDQRPYGEYRILSSESSVNGDQTWSVNDAWIAMGVSFTEVDGGSQSVMPLMMMLNH